MGYKYIIDSSAWVEYFGGSAKGMKIKAIIEQQSVATSIIAIAELADKFQREKHPFTAHLHFIQSKAAIINLSVHTCLVASIIKQEIRAKNSKFGLADALHLATAKNEEGILITTDYDFAGCEGVEII